VKSIVSMLPRGRMRVVLDVVLVVWVAIWIWLGTALGGEVAGLRRLSGTIAQVGTAVVQSGQLLSSFQGLPLVGSKVGSTARQIEKSGHSAVTSARVSRESASHLSWMLALAIAVIPSTPVLGLYLPARLIAIRERRTLARLWQVYGDDPDFHRLLARRALSDIPYTRLATAAGVDPWKAYDDGHYAGLVSAELDRWGISRRGATRAAALRQPVRHPPR
jgi:hypothetical protein